MGFRYIYQDMHWPLLKWNRAEVYRVMVPLTFLHGRLLGKLEGLGFSFQNKNQVESYLSDIVMSSAIEGEVLPLEQVRSSIASVLGLPHGGVPVTDRRIPGVVQLTLHALSEFDQKLSKETLATWHRWLFDYKMKHERYFTIGHYRKPEGGAMRVVSGAFGKEKIHFEAPEATAVPFEMQRFIKWYNDASNEEDLFVKAALAHLWFLTIHPFDDGNGRIARVLTDRLLMKQDAGRPRYYSLSAQLQKNKKQYYKQLEQAQRGKVDVTAWVIWFLHQLELAMRTSMESIEKVMHKSKFWNEHAGMVLNTRQQKMLNRLLDGKFVGHVTTTKWSKMNKCSQDTASRDLLDLAEKGLMEKKSAGRGTHFVLKHVQD